MSDIMTVAELRLALAEIPDDAPVMVHVKKGINRVVYDDLTYGVEKFAMPNGKVAFVIIAR